MPPNVPQFPLTYIPSRKRPGPTDSAGPVRTQHPFRAGQTAWVRGLKEILQTLDGDGKLDGLPFMPEMLPYCGRRFHVVCRPSRTCVEGVGICEFGGVVFLEDLRCDGGAHDGCQRRCLLFWKEAWLSHEPPAAAVHDAAAAAEAVLKTRRGERYFCQSTELAGAATARQADDPGLGIRLRRDLQDLRLGNTSLSQLSWHLSRKVSNRLRRLAGGADAHAVQGRRHRTETVSLGLQPGELVEVKSRGEIEATLDAAGKNRGLLFTPPMLRYCGRRFYVADRLRRMILEEDGRMIELKDTVVLDGVTCQAWGCQRANLQFWREIWLKRVAS